MQCSLVLLQHHHLGSCQHCTSMVIVSTTTHIAGSTLQACVCGWLHMHTFGVGCSAQCILNPATPLMQGFSGIQGRCATSAGDSAFMKDYKLGYEHPGFLAHISSVCAVSTYACAAEVGRMTMHVSARNGSCFCRYTNSSLQLACCTQTAHCCGMLSTVQASAHIAWRDPHLSLQLLVVKKHQAD